PDIIPDSVDRIVYLDSDVVVRRCISELYAADMTGTVALAVQDMVAGYVSAAPWGLANWFEAGRGPADLNFNGGVIVMDLEAWRREGIGRQAIDYVQSERFWRMVDQEGINAVAGSRIGDVDPRWNQQAVIFEDQFALFLPYPKRVIEQVRNDPWIVHFTGEAKPWAHPSDHPWAGEWYHYLELTAFRGWRPPQVARRTPASVQRWPRPPRGAAPPWSLHLENGAVASMSSNTSGRVRVTIETLGVRPWDVQVNYSLPGIDAGRTYVLKCDLKADRPRGAIIGVARRGGDWGGLGVFETVQLTSRWQTVIRRFGASDSASFGRVHFDLGAHESAVEIRRVSLHELPDGP
ncbi:MAG TPA: glycosyltransferase, partial [Acidimicrobiia bacterium]